MIFILRPAAAGADYDNLKRAVAGLLSRAGLLATDEEPSSLAGVKAGGGGKLKT